MCVTGGKNFEVRIVWRIKGKIIRTVLCCIVYHSCTCTQI